MAIPTIKGDVAALVNIEWRRGNTLDFYFEYFTDEAETIPWNLTGNTFKLDVVDKKTGKVILSFATGSGITLSNNNKLSFAKTSAQMKVLAGVYDYDLEMTNTTTGNVMDLQKGEWTINDDKTK